MNKTLIDNSSEALSMVHAIKECVNTEGVNHIRIATGYWDLLGTALVLDEFEKFLSIEGNRIDMLIGKDPFVYTSQLNKLPDNLGKPKYPDDFIRKNIEELDFSDENKRVVNLLNNYCEGDDPAFKIKLYKVDNSEEPSFLHSKCYIFSGKKATGSKWSYGIIGSSNFTRNGLKYPEGNSELNVLEEDYQFINFNDNEDTTKKGHVQWFEEKWNKIDELWNKDFLLKVLGGTPIQKQVEQEKKQKEENLEDSPLTPYELYIKLLQYNFGDIVDANITRQVESYLPITYKAYQYQTDAVTQCYNIMQRYGGFMLADVVGLGKTVVGTMLIKHFLSVPDINDRPRKVLIVTPPAIRKGWEDTIADFDNGRDDKIAPNVHMVTTGSIGSLFESEEDLEDTGEFESVIPNEEYGLILIDESHKFRNNQTAMYKALDALIANTPIQPYVGLLSATPQNNRPEDLRNQIYLFSRSHAASQFDGDAKNLEGFFADIKGRYVGLKLIEEEKQRKAELKEISAALRKNILDKILVRRTRTDVRGYKDENGNPILRFPEVAAPHKLKYELSPELAKLFKDTMGAIMLEENSESSIGYYRYRAIQYLNTAEKKDRYRGKGSLDTDRVALQLANIMKLLLVKRLESSFYAFKESLQKLYDDTCLMLDMLDDGTVFICPSNQIDVMKELQENKQTGADNIRKKIEKLNQAGLNPKGSNAEYSSTDFTPEFKEALKHDRDALKHLCDCWKNVEDRKKEVFREELCKLLPESEPNKKLVIFTESADTLNDIKKVVEEEDFSVLSITAENRNKKQQEIQENFDANYKGEHKNNYQVIISTDVLAEGINLHRAYTIINYDTPWNSTKLMQRIGRVNRIGSVAKEVHVYNFLPSDEGDSIIGLFNRAFTKLQSFHSTFGEDAQVYTDDEEINHFEVAQHDLEETESPLMKYLFELREYKQKHPKRYDVIAAKTGSLELAVTSEPKESLFMIKSEQSGELYIHTDAEGNRQSIAKEVMFEKFKVDETSSTTELPDDVDRLRRRAIRQFDVEFEAIRATRYQQKYNDARNTLQLISSKYSPEEETMHYLKDARELIDRGNVDVCHIIAKIGKALNVQEPDLFSLTKDEVSAFIEKNLKAITENMQADHGSGVILLALYKK